MLEAPPVAPFADTAIVLLAAGRSTRFATGDKLMAEYGGAPMILRCAGLLRREAVKARIAIVGDNQPARSEALSALNWSVSLCQAKTPSMAASLVLGVRLAQEAGAEAALIILADMPELQDNHLFALQAALTAGHIAAISINAGIPMPPAIFRRDVFPRLLELEGDEGARRLFRTMPGVGMIDIDPRQAMDIDTVADLAQALAKPTASP